MLLSLKCLLKTIGQNQRTSRLCAKQSGLTDAHNKLPSEISGGMQKRVAIARAIVNKPKYLFVIEQLRS
jgi:phospholipid/cholesterol/gamma-HCH transport system ATP-binding protein